MPRFPRATVAAAAVLALCAATAHAYTPKAKWGQDMDVLFLTIFAPCDPDSRSVHITNSSFSFACDTADKGTALLEFAFQEDVADKHANTSCTALRGGACALALDRSDGNF